MLKKLERIHFKEEKKKIAKKLGYKTYEEAIISIYNNCGSLRRTARVFDCTSLSISGQLKKLGQRVKGVGGNYKIPHGNFIFINESKSVCKNCKHKNFINIYRKESVFFCKDDNIHLK